MLQISIRIADPSEYSELSDLYRSWGYSAGISATDRVYLAVQRARPVGIVRRTHEHSTTMLRGMYVDPADQCQGIGRQLLMTFVADLGPEDCFCIPFAHLHASTVKRDSLWRRCETPYHSLGIGSNDTSRKAMTYS
jgi:GNAT superfamily N-acetyltransferase